MTNKKKLQPTTALIPMLPSAGTAGSQNATCKLKPKRMNINSVLLIIFALLASCHTENDNRLASKSDMASPDTLKGVEDFFGYQKAKVLVLGTFHFDYPGLDVKKVAEEDKIDVLDEKRQEELKEMLTYIKRFKPNKVVIEANEAFNATGALRAYKNGVFNIDTAARDERYQVAMRLAAELDLDTLYSVDADGLIIDLSAKFPEYVSELSKGYDYESEDEFEAIKQEWYDYKDKLVKNMSLLEYHKYINSPAAHEIGFGVYLKGDFELDKFRGADNLSVNWYNRNLRIFRNIQNIKEGPNDRIFVLFGNGHAAILRQLFICSPDFEFVEFHSL